MFKHMIEEGLRVVAGWHLVSTSVTFLSGIATFVVAQGATQNLVVGVVATAIATLIVGIVANYPKWIKARGDDWASILREIRRTHAEEMHAFKQRVVFQNRERALMRATKHKLAGQVQYSRDYIALMEIEIAKHNNNCPECPIELLPYNRVNIAELFMEEDEAMKDLTAKQLDEMTNLENITNEHDQ